MCFTILSCSAASLVFIHNNTEAPFEFKLKEVTGRKKEYRIDSAGTLLVGEVKETSVYFSDSLVLEVTQDGNTRTAEFKGNTLPVSAPRWSAGDEWAHIKVSQTGFTVGPGSGMWFEDLQHRFGILWIPLVCLSLLAAVGVVIAWNIARRKPSTKTAISNLRHPVP